MCARRFLLKVCADTRAGSDAVTATTAATRKDSMRCADFRDELSPHMLREDVPPVPAACGPPAPRLTPSRTLRVGNWGRLGDVAERGRRAEDLGAVGGEKTSRPASEASSTQTGWTHESAGATRSNSPSTSDSRIAHSRARPPATGEQNKHVLLDHAHAFGRARTMADAVSEPARGRDDSVTAR